MYVDTTKRPFNEMPRSIIRTILLISKRTKYGPYSKVATPPPRITNSQRHTKARADRPNNSRLKVPGLFAVSNVLAAVIIPPKKRMY